MVMIPESVFCLEVFYAVTGIHGANPGLKWGRNSRSESRLEDCMDVFFSAY